MRPRSPRCFFGGTIVAIAGSVIVAWTVGDAHPSHHVMAILLGSLATSLVLFLGCVTTGMLAAKVFLAWSAVVLAAGAWTLRSAPEVERRDGLDVLAIVAIAILVAALCHHTASTLPSIQATGIVPIWSDYSIHGTEIAQFGDPHVQGLSSFLLAGQPLVFYHYASYMLPGCRCRRHQPSSMGRVRQPAAPLRHPADVARRVCVRQVASRCSGSDDSLRRRCSSSRTHRPTACGNGFFGFHWLLFTAPGSGYGLSAAFTALTLMVIWRSRHRRACLWLGILVTAAAFEFRAQIFLVLAPAMAASLLGETAFARRHARALVLAMALTAITVTICLVTWHDARDAWLRSSALRPFLEVVHSGMSPTAYDGAYTAIDRRYGSLVGTTLGVLGAHPGCARRLGARAADSVCRSRTTHRLEHPRYVSDVVCRGVARRGAARADGQLR